VLPVYAHEAIAKGLKGKVVMSLVVNASGRAEEIRVISSEYAELEECAMKALEQWEFQPAIVHGEAVAAEARVEMLLDATRT